MKQVESYTAHKQEGILLNANECWHGLDRELTEKVIAALAEIPSNRYPDTNMHALLCAYAQYAGLKEENLLAGNGSDQMLGYLMIIMRVHTKQMSGNTVRMRTVHGMYRILSMPRKNRTRA